MTFGKLSDKQAAVVGRVVRKRPVLDLGAGDLGLSLKLLALGARRIYAIDHSPMDFLFHHEFGAFATIPKEIERVVMPTGRLYGGSYFGCKIAMLSWPPIQGVEGLVEVLDEIPYVLYLGKNSRAMGPHGFEESPWCGDEALFRYLVRRSVAAYVPHEFNTLIVYGPAKVDRAPKGEELAALTNRERSSTWRMEDVEKEARRLAAAKP